jgi:NodT family efflux transporter outer membrane factor (OMF) lipoprotein
MSDSGLINRISIWGPLAVLLILALLSGCTVGPDFAVPPQPEVPLKPLLLGPVEAAKSCQRTDPQAVRFCITQRLIGNHDVPGEWWKLFRSKALTALMERALWENHDLKAAQAALRGAHASYESQRGAWFPVISASYLPSKQKVATRDFNAPTWSELPYYTLHTATLTIAYVPDVFGGIRRQIEVASAQEDLQRFMLEATYLTLTSNIALAAIQEASLRRQIVVTLEAIDEEKLLKKSNLNHDAKVDDAALDAGISQAQQTLPLLARQLAVQRDLLAALSGQFAGVGLPEQFWLNEMQLPRDLPVSLSSRIVEQRPDVRAAEANLHAAVAAVGVAIANRLPLFNLYGNAGLMSSQFKYLGLTPQTLFWTLAGSVTQTIFDGFTLEQRQHAAEAGWDQAAEQYQTTVVNAFQNVADALQAIDRDTDSVRWAAAAKEAAARNRCLTVAVFVKYNGQPGFQLDPLVRNPQELKRWWERRCAHNRGIQPPYYQEKDGEPVVDKAGSDVLVAEQLYLSSQITLVQAEGTRLSDVVALFQALGGGWWNRTDTALSEPPVVLPAPPPN